ncbi:MAG: cobamide remodeling phosphodiesterase CbiR [Syntrophobacteraceae bacterium]|nr:cobamide remodeling phosphodiesterase CbiR [Syntrophobacteraceae bacterium]
MRVLLLEHPREISEAHCNDIANTPLWSCLMTGYAGAALARAGFAVDIFDAARKDFGQALARLSQSPFPDFLAVHAVYFWEKTETLFRMLSDLRALGFDAPICLFGFFPGLVWKEILDSYAAVDFVVVGEPEETLVELSRSIEGKQKAKWGEGVCGLAFRSNGKAFFNGARPSTRSLDELGFPLRPSVAEEETVSVLASRGCYNHCSFCLIPTLDSGKSGGWRGRSPQNIALEISELVSRGKRDFYFVDPNFVGPGKAGHLRARELARLLAKLGIGFGIETRANDVTADLMKELVQGGLSRLLLGIESGAPEVLRRLGKHASAVSNESAIASVREAGLEPEIGFIMFDGQSSIEDIRTNLEFLERNRLLDRLGRTANLLCHELIALKGTRGFDEGCEKKLIAPQGLFGFEARLLYRDARVGRLALAARSVCLFVLKEMGKPFSPIHWAGETSTSGPYRKVNDLLVEIFERLLSCAEKGRLPPEGGDAETLLQGLQEELGAAFSLPEDPGRQDKGAGHRGKDAIRLPRLKGCFPFRLATTSYILPDEILPNVEFLGQYLDEIELVFFESGSVTNLPTAGEVREMARVATDRSLTYNVHLPADLFLGDPDRALRRKFCETALSFYERTLPLSPSCHVLHLDSRRGDKTVEKDVSAWGERISESLAFLQSKGMELEAVAVENLEYPLQRILPFVHGFNLSICLDIGHLLRYGHDILEQTTLLSEKIKMVHLHGVDNGKDHRGLHNIADAQWRTIRRFLHGYRGGLSVEVFSLEDLAASLNRMVELKSQKKEK